MINPPSTRSLATVSRTAETVLAAEKHYSQSMSTYANVNLAAGSLFTGAYSGVDGRIPDASFNTYPWPNGLVTPAHNGRANFVFVDGHVKALKPPDTNPNGGLQPQDNVWDAGRT